MIRSNTLATIATIGTSIGTSIGTIEIEALPEEDQELRGERTIFTLTLPEKLYELLVKYSSRTVLRRKIAWQLKFKTHPQYRKDKKADIEKNLTTADLQKATLTKVKLVQRKARAEKNAGFESDRPCQTFDYVGLLNIRKGRSVVKRWGAIFT